MAKPCCGDPVDIDGIYQPLSLRLLNFGKEVYRETTSTQRVFMWVFSFYNAKDECPVCKHGIERLYGWFSKYGLTEDPVRGVRIVLDDEADMNAIYNDLHFDIAPVNIFTDSEGKIIDILFEFPDESWLDKYILPFVQKDMRIL